jgi:hypothetical protein
LISDRDKHIDLALFRLTSRHALQHRHIQPVPSRQGVHWHLLIEGALLAAFAMRAHAAFGLWLAAALVA